VFTFSSRWKDDILMSTEENKALDYCMVDEGFNKANLAVIEDLVDNDILDHSLSGLVFRLI